MVFTATCRYVYRYRRPLYAGLMFHLWLVKGGGLKRRLQQLRKTSKAKALFVFLVFSAWVYVEVRLQQRRRHIRRRLAMSHQERRREDEEVRRRGEEQNMKAQEDKDEVLRLQLERCRKREKQVVRLIEKRRILISAAIIESTNLHNDVVCTRMRVIVFSFVVVVVFSCTFVHGYMIGCMVGMHVDVTSSTKFILVTMPPHVNPCKIIRTYLHINPHTYSTCKLYTHIYVYKYTPHRLYISSLNICRSIKNP